MTLPAQMATIHNSTFETLINFVKDIVVFLEKCGKYCRFYRTLFIHDNSFRVFCSRNTQISFLEEPPGTIITFKHNKY